MDTKTLEIDPARFDESSLDEPARIIKDGGLVVFPTETVYGIGVNLNNPEAVKRLYAIKQRPPEKDLTTHISSRDDIVKYARRIPGYAQRLVRKFWPGPLTLILRGLKDDTIGLRFPSLKVAQVLIRKSGVQLGAPSANISGEEPCVTGREAVKVFDGKVDWIISAGTTQYKCSSTIVKAVDNNGTILREGAIPRPLIEDVLYRLILFVCTGNTCRSPLAEAILKRKLDQEGKFASKYRVMSSGLAAVTGMRASQSAILAGGELGASLKEHVSQPLTISMVEEADMVYVMTQEHRRTILEWLPELEETVQMLDPNGDIEDPMGSGIDVYRKCAQKIKTAIDKFVKL